MDWRKFHSMVHRSDLHRVFLSKRTYEHIQEISVSVGRQADWDDTPYGEHCLHDVTVYRDERLPFCEILIMDPKAPLGSRTYKVPQ